MHRTKAINKKVLITSGVGTNLKVGGTDPAPSAETFFLAMPLHFLALKAQLVVLVSAFVMVSTVWSVYCLLFFYTHGALRAQPFVKVDGGTRAPVPHGIGATAYHCLYGSISCCISHGPSQ